MCYYLKKCIKTRTFLSDPKLLNGSLGQVHVTDVGLVMKTTTSAKLSISTMNEARLLTAADNRHVHRLDKGRVYPPIFDLLGSLGRRRGEERIGERRRVG